MKRHLAVVNCADVSEPGWTFLSQQLTDLPLAWFFHSARPRSALERWLRRPNLARFRSCWEAARQAGTEPGSVIVSHLPLTTLWTAVFSRLLNAKTRHIAFAFNFTVLPTGIRRTLMRWAFAHVDRFIVFSRAERQLYADHFGIDRARIDFLPWTMDPPQSSASPRISGKYVCAVGGEGRDYDTLVDSIRGRPQLETVIVTRSYNVPAGPLPDHVKVHTDLGSADFWNVVRHSHAVVLPLRDDETCCGHITLVGALRLGRPIVASRSRGIADYVQDGVDALLVPPADATALGHAIQTLWDDRELYARLQAAIVNDRAADRSASAWPDYFRAYFLGLLADPVPVEAGSAGR